jgi:hypothetical protein
MAHLDNGVRVLSTVLGIKKEWRLLASHAEGMARIRVMVANDFMLLMLCVIGLFNVVS